MLGVRSSLVWLWGLVAALAGQGTAAVAADRPNVVFFLIDDLGRNDLGCYGSTFYRTPHCDRLAREGMKFTDAYAACPVCSPTRAAIMTGKYPARLNLTDWLPGRPDRPDQKLLRPVIRQELPLEETTIAEALKSAGYVTGHVGKWHLGGVGFEPQRQGFDVNAAGDHTGTPLSYFAPFKNNQGRFMPGLEKASEGEYLPDRLTSEAEKFLDANKDRPFFLYFPHYSVHTPLRAKSEVVAKYQNNLPPGRQSNPVYAAMVESMDDSVGRILKKLDELKLVEKTLVIFTSDNGGLSAAEGMRTPSTINSPLREGKGFLYEGGTRVSLLIRWPGQIRAASTCSTPVCSIDFLPTLLEFCGGKGGAKVDGVSIVPLLRDTGGLTREALYWHYPHYSNQSSRPGPGAAVRAGDFKLIEFYENGRRELFNLKDDLGESNNLVEKHPEIVHRLAAQLDAWRRETGAKMMRPNSDYVPNPQAADGSITLAARTAEVHGVQLRYEAMPHKNTLGFWSRAEDWASWEFTVTKPGKFTVEIEQGCGKGHGGSEVEVTIGGQALRTVVEDTGGWQSFKVRAIGEVAVDKSGRFTLTVKPKSKAGVAVMDLRSVRLKPVNS